MQQIYSIFIGCRFLLRISELNWKICTTETFFTLKSSKSKNSQQKSTFHANYWLNDSKLMPNIWNTGTSQIIEIFEDNDLPDRRQPSININYRRTMQPIKNKWKFRTPRYQPSKKNWKKRNLMKWSLMSSPPSAFHPFLWEHIRCGRLLLWTC